MPSREYSDSEDDAPTPTTTVRVGSSVTGSPKATTSSGPRVKLTLRPNITHLLHDDPPPPQSERSSLSPPPPLTLKIGPRPQPGPSRMTNRIDYSDSSDDDESRPNKKPKVNKGLPIPTASGSSLAEGPNSTRKSYDWLAPSAVGASHSGPPERNDFVKEKKPGEDEMEIKKPKVKSDKPGGRGKNWRKGVTKGMLGAMKEAEAFNHSSHGSYTPGDVTPSIQGSPEIIPHDTLPRVPSPPFIPADASTLGIPIFTKPIIAPKLHYTLWPKVSPAFSPINGGDVGPFPRKEHVRAWKHSQKTLVGIGGGTLRFNTWTRGPPSQLSLLVKADKEAKDLLAKKNKAGGSATPSERPQLHTSLSTDSVPTLVQPTDVPVDDASEPDVDDTASVISTKEGTIVPQPIAPIPAKRKTPAPKVPKPKVGPRKSKLAQEIHPIPDSATSAIEDIM